MSSTSNQQLRTLESIDRPIIVREQENRNNNTYYLLFVLFGIMLLIGIIFAVSSDKTCPTSYGGVGCVEEQCIGASGGIYECHCGAICTDKKITAGAIAGIVLIVVGSFAFCITACCFCCKRPDIIIQRG